MKTGDPKKAAVLGAVALIIVGVAIFQIIPKPHSAPTAEVARAEGQVVATTEKKTTAALPTTLTSQPFAKPKIPPPVAPPLPSTAIRVKRLTGGRTSGPMGNVPPFEPTGEELANAKVSPDGTSSLPDASGKQSPAGGTQTGAIGMPPGENTGNSQQLKGEPPKTLTFNGVMEVHGRTAMITVSDKPDDVRECKVGSKVAGYTVINITADTLILHRDKTTLKFTVGSSHSL
ncbi:MAG TPA: hypothetical protein VGL56_01730 [Fimbriimonadaceae bacterium]|jgi:hypothetical protein